jgi:thioredoxin 1
MNHIVNLTELGVILNKYDFTILKFSAEWCGPCKRISPLFEQLSKDEKYSSVHFTEVDVDVSQDICKEYEIEGLPTFILFENNKELSRFSGANESKLRHMLDSVLSNERN